MEAAGQLAAAHTPWIGPQGQRIECLELPLTYTCPNAGSFCSSDRRMGQFRQFAVSWERIARCCGPTPRAGKPAPDRRQADHHPRLVAVLALGRKLRMRPRWAPTG